ncbi:MAG: hypothetical protein ACOX2L_03730 [Anaerolineae bacterium]|jgi:hypothetical protein
MKRYSVPRTVFFFLLSLVIMVALVGNAPQRATAAGSPETIRVNTFNDGQDYAVNGVCSVGDITDGPCSLRAALTEAQFHIWAGTSVTIELPPGEYKLTVTEPAHPDDDDDWDYGDLDVVYPPPEEVDARLVIYGLGPGPAVINAQGIDRVLEIGIRYKVEIYRVVFKNGLTRSTTSDYGWGGGIYFQGRELLLSEVSFIGNEARGQAAGSQFQYGLGGALAVRNNAQGEGMVRIFGGDYLDNKADLGSAILRNEGYAFLSIYGATFHGNESGPARDVIRSETPMYLVNSTVTGNTARPHPDTGITFPLGVSAFRTTWIQNSTLENEGGQGNLLCNGAECWVRSSLFRKNSASGSPNCAVVNNGRLLSEGGNIADDYSCWEQPAEGDRVISSGDWQLAQRFGYYWMPYGTSPVLDRSPYPCEALMYIGPDGLPVEGGLYEDQRGNGRDDGACDAGAIEGITTFGYLPWTVR